MTSKHYLQRRPRALVVAPFWDEARHHPHRRRVVQWCAALARTGYQVVLAALGSEFAQRDWAHGRILTAVHPRLCGPERRILLSKGKRWDGLIRAQLEDLLRGVFEAGPVHIAVACHPIVASALNAYLPRASTIVDLLDSPAAESLSHESVLEGRWAATLGEAEAAFIRDHRIAVAGWMEVPPVMRSPRRARSVRPTSITLLGAAHPASFAEVLDVLGVYLPRAVRDRYGLTVTVCGEVARGLASVPGVRIEAPAWDLRPYLQNTVCVLPPSVSRTGRSYRILDAVESGAFLLASPSAARGYGLVPGEHYHAFTTPAQAEFSLQNLLEDPAIAAEMSHAAQALFACMSTVAGHQMDRLFEMAGRGNA